MKTALLLFLLMQTAGGDPPQDNPAPPAEDSQDRVQVGATGLLDVRFHNVDVFIALEMLSEQAQRNIIVANGATGTISLVLRRVTFEEALRAILTSCGLRHEDRDNIIYVLPDKPKTGSGAAEDKEKDYVMRVFRLNYISAAEAESFIKPLLGQECRVTRTAGDGGGAGASGTATGSGGSKDVGGGGPAGEEVLVLVGPPPQVEVITQALAEIDTRPRQVLVEATILRATLNDQNALGIDFNTLAGIDFQLMQANSPAVTDVQLGTVPNERLDRYNVAARTDFKAQVPAGGFTFGIVKDRIAAFIRALEQVTDVTIMANPKVLTLNKQRAEVIVGRRDGYLTTTVTETAAIQSVQYLETGTKLVFRPVVLREGYVRMEIHPEDSNGGLTAANLPFQETTEATTNILLKDGHTVLIGGLFRERTLSGKSQVPLLGSIPGLGYLFGVTQNTTTREEVIILLTVHVLKDDAKEREMMEALSEDIERLRVGARHGLMGIGREQMADAWYQAAVEALRKGRTDAALSRVRLALHLHPRHQDAIRLREQLLGERTWHADGARMRTFMQELLRKEAGLAPRGVFDRPDANFSPDAHAAPTEIKGGKEGAEP